MKTALLFVCASALALTAQAAPFCTPAPGVWCEQPVGPDAGQQIATAQVTTGTGSLNSIYGEINGLGGADLFKINIANTSAFTASYAAASGTGITGDSQAGLYLLNASGHGIEAADGATALTGFNAAPGIYYIGITGDGNVPEYTVNGTRFAIFSPFAAGQISLPVAGAGPLSAWSGQGCGANCAGGYDISLTGAQYAATPEPGSLALVGSMIGGLGLLRGFRRS